MVSSAIAITENREKVVDFSVPFMYYTEDVLMKKQSSEQVFDLLQFMNPFENQVWFCTLGTLVIISIAVFVINYYSPYGYKDENGKGTAEEFSFFNSVWFALACMLQQGGDNTPRSLSGINENVISAKYYASFSISEFLPFGRQFEASLQIFQEEDGADFVTGIMSS